ncbi:CsgE family curli-type amyloid fiber assembly protein [Algoriphagus namhaensis]
MRYLFSFALTVFLWPASWAQNVEVAVAKSDTVKTDTTKVLQEAPEELMELFESITQEVTKADNGGDVVLEIDGLVIDETKTKSGREFYDLFYRDWTAPEGAKNYSIFIVEKPFRLNQTFIEVSINETMVYQTFLQPRYEFIETIAQESIASTQFYLAQYEELVRQLGGEDQSGSGIF